LFLPNDILNLSAAAVLVTDFRF